ncbi:hypothetical protein PRIC1_001135 [Phytophthora ramorum]
MIRFKESETFRVEKCNLKSVRDAMHKMKEEGKLLPFFVLDELSITGLGGKNEVAFQRNVFRVCGLVVIVMGTDANISGLVDPCASSSQVAHNWAAVIPRFPSYQLLLQTQSEEHVWSKAVERFPVVQEIVMRSRGRFGKYFVNEVVKCLAENSDGKLSDLLDQAFTWISKRTLAGKGFMKSQEGHSAQRAAITFTSVEDPAAERARLEVGTSAMHRHFANLRDEQIVHVKSSLGKLWGTNEE